MKTPQITKKTKIGMALWACCVLLMLYTPRIYDLFSISNPIRITKYNKEQIAWHEAQATKHMQREPFKRKAYRKPPHRFNPNQYKLEDWMYLGLSNKQAQAVLKFCRYPLKSNADLEKIFIIPSELYALIKDSTYYEKNTSFSPYPAYQQQHTPTTVSLLTMLELDSTRLVALPGIGPFYAKMVMKYEKALGGFCRKEQLLEVYKMNEETYAILCKHLDFSSPNIRKLSINRCTKEELAKHPYIDAWQANSIVKMRIQKGGFHDLQELLDSHLINAEIFDKILPYVSL
jgi:DNA uptake protein ComE-like DNA-binding protein